MQIRSFSVNEINRDITEVKSLIETIGEPSVQPLKQNHRNQFDELSKRGLKTDYANTAELLAAFYDHLLLLQLELIDRANPKESNPSDFETLESIMDKQMDNLLIGTKGTNRVQIFKLNIQYSPDLIKSCEILKTYYAKIMETEKANEISNAKERIMEALWRYQNLLADELSIVEEFTEKEKIEHHTLRVKDAQTQTDDSYSPHTLRVKDAQTQTDDSYSPRLFQKTKSPNSSQTVQPEKKFTFAP